MCDEGKLLFATSWLKKREKKWEISCHLKTDGSLGEVWNHQREEGVQIVMDWANKVDKTGDMIDHY